MDERVRRYSMHLELEFKLPVISAVLFLKGGPTGVELRKVEKKIAGRVFNTFHYFAFGLSKSLAENYVDLPQVLAAALAALMRSKIWDRPEKKLRCKRNWFSYFRCSNSDEEAIDLMAKSGCKGVFLGVESGLPDEHEQEGHDIEIPHRHQAAQ